LYRAADVTADASADAADASADAISDLRSAEQYMHHIRSPNMRWFLQFTQSHAMLKRVNWSFDWCDERGDDLRSGREMVFRRW
jgi:hypothetical protein